jgi:NADH dehydrogenase
MNIFITGATGFLGSNLLKRLIPEERIDKIFLLTRKSLPPDADVRIEYIRGDLETVKDVVLKEKVDVVIHLAAAMRSENFKELHKVNVEGTANLVEFCRKNHARRIIFASSINVHLKNQGAYAKSKILAEDLVKNSGLEYCIFRFALVYGLNDGGLCRIVDFIKKYKLVPVFGDGKKLEQPIYIDEAVDFLLKGIFLNKSNLTVDLCGKTSISYNEMVLLLGRALKIKVALVHIPVSFVIFIIRFLNLLKLPCPLTCEQVYHINEDLSLDMNQALADFSVELKDMEVN